MFICLGNRHWNLSGKWGVTTFTQVLSTRPACRRKEIMAWSLSGFPSGPTPVLHIFLVLRFMQSHSPTANAGGPPLCFNHNKFYCVFDCYHPSSSVGLPDPGTPIFLRLSLIEHQNRQMLVHVGANDVICTSKTAFQSY